MNCPPPAPSHLPMSSPRVVRDSTSVKRISLSSKSKFFDSAEYFSCFGQKCSERSVRMYSQPKAEIVASVTEKNTPATPLNC